MDDKQKLHLEEQINELESKRGQHTELVTVMIPAGFNIHSVTKQLEAERSTADNIKSKQTRTAVTTAIDSIIRNLKNMKQTPPNGLAIFAGNVSEKEGGQDIQVWAIEPPKPLKVRIYRCDKTFVIEPLKEMLQIDEVYGLLAIDRQEATIGVLEGKKIEIIRRLTSGVPGKVRAGGQCLAPDTLIMKNNGEIIEIQETHNPLVILSENLNTKKIEETPIIAKWENAKELYQIKTCYPQFEIKASKNHTFFVRGPESIEEKQLCDIKEGDYLIMPEKINIKGEKQTIEFKPVVLQTYNIKQITIPEQLDEKLARIAGYYLGDGHHERDRIAFSEQRKEVINYYRQLVSKTFNVEPTIRYRENKGYYQMRVGSKILAQFFRYLFPEKDKTHLQTIPSLITKSPDEIISSFIGGFFDAEGYVSNNRIAAGFNNEKLAKQLQMLLLRLGIIASINIYDNRANPYSKNTRFTIAIDDKESIKIFNESVKFCYKDKNDKVEKILQDRSNRNKVRKIAVSGREIARIIRNSGLNTRQFGCPDFFNNNKELNKELFKKKILDKIKNEELKIRLSLFYTSNLIATKIKEIRHLGEHRTVDIETKNHNFIANGLIVHNSSQRYHRVTEGLAKEFFRRVADAMKEIFFEMPRLKGILVGGPIPTKEDFLEEGELVTKLKEKVIAVKDIGYTDEHGLKLLVEASQEDIAGQEIIKEKKILEKFFNMLGKEREKTAYGEEKVSLALERGAAGLILLSKSLPKGKIAEFEKKAELVGAEVTIISMETPEGEQFYNITKGIGAILRFAIE